jgi:HEAT repeat protein
MAGLLHFERSGLEAGPEPDAAAVLAGAGSPLVEAAAADWHRACLGDWEAWLREPRREGEPEGYRAWALARAVVVSPEPGWFRSFVQWALVQGDGAVREWMLGELLRTGRLDLGETVLGCLSHPAAGVRRLACRYLGAAGSRLAENALVERLSDEDLPTVFLAAEALGRIRSPQTVRHLGAWLSDPAFGALPPHVREALAPCREARNRVLLPEAADALAPELLGEFSALDPLGRVCLLESLRQTGAPLQFRTLLEKALSDPDECVWLHALEMVAHSEDGTYAAKILPALMDSRASIRGLVCRYLALTRCQQAKTAFRKLMQDDPEPMVREWAARGLGRLRDPGTLAALMPLVKPGVYETLDPEMQKDLSYFRKLALTAADRRP